MQGDATPRRAKLQFKLRSLLLAVIVVAIPAHWYSARARVATSRREYHRVLGSCYDGSLTSAELQMCSRRLLRDELSVPFADRQRAITEYLDRLSVSIWVQRKKIAYAYTAELDDEQERLRRLLDERGRLLDLRRPGHRSIPAQAITRNSAN
jgi:hypothetical protein